MSESLPANSPDPARLPTKPPSNLLDAALAHLPQEQQRALAQKALERQLEIDARAVEAEHRYRTSSVEMANTIDQVRKLESATQSDYSIRAEYQTASGRTQIEIKKSQSNVVIVIAIVVAILAFLVLSRL